MAPMAALGRSAAPRRRPLASARGAQRCGGRGSLGDSLGAFWGAKGSPAGRYCDGLSHNNLALIVRVANPQPPLRGRPSLRRRGGRPRRARLARCQGSFLLWTGSAKTRLRRAASREAARIRPERLPEKAVGASNPAAGRGTHTRGTACLPRAALPNKGAPRP